MSRAKLRRCIYCGYPAAPGPMVYVTCHAHRDLLALDPMRAPVLRLSSDVMRKLAQP